LTTFALPTPGRQYASGSYVGPVWTGSDGASTITPDPNHFCASGTAIQVPNDAGGQPDYTNAWGVLLGWNLNQAEPGGTPSPADLSGMAAINVAIVGAMGLNLRITLAVNDPNTGASTSYCAPLPSDGGIIALSSLTKDCWAGGGAAFDPATMLPVNLSIQVVTDPYQAYPFDFCATALSIDPTETRARPVCAKLPAGTALPTMGTACAAAGESWCDADGNRCVCEDGIWFCNTTCSSDYPTPPTPNTACASGAACSYPSGVGCMCVNERWRCLGGDSCPPAASMPMTGQACDSSTGLACDYPNSNPAFHMGCICGVVGELDGGSSTWTCIQWAACPATQPAYPASTCAGVALCSYGSTLCTCSQSGSPWVCDWPSTVLTLF
jgi:hypothetical protein